MQAKPQPLPDDPAPWRCDPATVPPREYMLGQMYQRGTVNMIAGADHVVTAAIMLVEAVGRAAGRDLLTGEQIAPHRTWLLSAQESQDELNRRITALCGKLGIIAGELGDRLVAQSVAGQLLHVATLNANGCPVIDEEAVQWLERGVVEKSIDTLALAPLGGFHHVNSREDFDMQTVAGALAGIAVRTGCAIDVTTHLTKKSEEPSGAPALLHAMHVVRTVTTMTAVEADKLYIPTRERGRYIKVVGKLGPVVVAETWFRLDGDCELIAVPWRPDQARRVVPIGKTIARSSPSAI